MKRYFYSIFALSISAVLHGASSSSEQAPQGRICFSDLPHPMHVYESFETPGYTPAYISHNLNLIIDTSRTRDWDLESKWALRRQQERINGRPQAQGFRTFEGIIEESSLQNPRLKKGFPALFTLRYRNQDGQWNCSDRYVMPRAFLYRDLDLQEFAVEQPLGEVIHRAPLKRFPAEENETLFSLLLPEALPELQESSIPQDISMYLELNRFDGPLLHRVSDYFRCFPKLGYLSLKRYMQNSSDFLYNVVCPAAIFSRVQEGRDPHESLNHEYAQWRNRLPDFTDGVAWDTMPELQIGDIPAWSAQCMRTKNSSSLLGCLKPWLTPAAGRVIDLRNHTIDPEEIQRIQGEGNLFILSTQDHVPTDYYRYPGFQVKPQITEDLVDEINQQLAQQCSRLRACIDKLYAWRYYLTAGAMAGVLGAYIYHNHSNLVADRAAEIKEITTQLTEKIGARDALQTVIQSAQSLEAVEAMTGEQARAVLLAQQSIKGVVDAIADLRDKMPESWGYRDLLSAAIKNKIGAITGIGAGTYIADVCAKYFFGYRPYVPSRIHVQNDCHDYFADRLPWHNDWIGSRRVNNTADGHCCEICRITKYYGEPRDHDALIPHYDEVTEQRFKRNQSIAIVAAWAAAVYGLHKTLQGIS